MKDRIFPTAGKVLREGNPVPRAREAAMTQRLVHAHGHTTKLVTPKVEDRLENEAKATGNQCPKCKYWNLKHRRMCKRCGKRVRPSPTMLKQMVLWK